MLLVESGGMKRLPVCYTQGTGELAEGLELQELLADWGQAAVAAEAGLMTRILERAAMAETGLSF